MISVFSFDAVYLIKVPAVVGCDLFIFFNDVEVVGVDEVNEFIVEFVFELFGGPAEYL